MARSSYIYVIVNSFNEPTHAFTVKHELVSFLHRYPGQQARRVFRLPDNREGAIIAQPATNYAEGKEIK